MEPKTLKDQAWLFQPEIIVETPDLGPAFIRRKLPDGLAPTDGSRRQQADIMRMIYRNATEGGIRGRSRHLPRGAEKRALDGSRPVSRLGLGGARPAISRVACPLGASDEDFNENDKTSTAGDILKAESNFAAATKTILQRVSAVREGARSQVEQMMSDRIDLWTREASNPAAHLGYAMRKDGKTVPLLKHTTGRDWEAFTCLNSLRDVEPPVSLIHADHSMEERVMEMAVPEESDDDAEY